MTLVRRKTNLQYLGGSTVTFHDVSSIISQMLLADSAGIEALYRELDPFTYQKIEYLSG